MTRIPFGRHCGKRLDEVPRSYLTWMLRLPYLSPKLKDAIRCFLYSDDEPEQHQEHHHDHA